MALSRAVGQRVRAPGAGGGHRRIGDGWGSVVLKCVRRKTEGIGERGGIGSDYSPAAATCRSKQPSHILSVLFVVFLIVPTTDVCDGWCVPSFFGRSNRKEATKNNLLNTSRGRSLVETCVFLLFGLDELVGLHKHSGLSRLFCGWVWPARVGLFCSVVHHLICGSFKLRRASLLSHSLITCVWMKTPPGCGSPVAPFSQRYTQCGPP